MNKDLKRLENAFREQRLEPDSKVKAEAISAAMRSFHTEKKSAAAQGISEQTRLKEQGGRNETLSNWRRVMNSIQSKWTYGLAGSASVAVLAMMIVGPNVGDVLLPQESLLENPVVANKPLKPENETALVDNPQNREATGLSSPGVALNEAVRDEGVSRVANEAADLLSANRSRQQSQPQLHFNKGVNVGGAVPATKSLSIAPSTIDVPSQQFQGQGRDKFEAVDANPVKIVREDPVSTFSVDVDTASYSFMRASLNSNVLPQKNAIRIEELVNYFDYDYDVPTEKSAPFKANVSIMPTPWNAGTKLLSIGIKGYELPQVETPSSNLVFLIDSSGSMNAPNKLPLLRNSFKLLLSTLKPDDTVSIVTYAGGAGTVLEPTKASQKGKILAALDSLRAGGATAGAEGIRQAYNLAQLSFKEGGVNRVILATDGDFNVGISDTEALKSYIERKRETGITLSVLGFGRGNYNDQLMQTLAQNGNGNASYIDTLSEARKVLVEEAGSTLFAIAKDVKLQVEFNPALVGEYRLVGYETRVLDREDFNNDKVDAGDIGAGHTVTALYEITPPNSASALVDPLRYNAPETQFDGDASEYGFLKIRYKLPDSNTSSLITQVIDTGHAVQTVDAASQDSRFAASVAAFGQLLRGGQYTQDFDYDDVIELAQSGRGIDPFGYRSEFINLVRLAKSAAALQPLKQ
ncbi:MAG: VWA domain-containing protein [Pseudomonadota bacterium]